jgi:DUF1016 N-terminal domain
MFLGRSSLRRPPILASNHEIGNGRQKTTREEDLLSSLPGGASDQLKRSCSYTWSIGRDILARQDAQRYGAKVIERLVKHLGSEFPGVEGFSPRNLKYMRSLEVHAKFEG